MGFQGLGRAIWGSESGLGILEGFLVGLGPPRNSGTIGIYGTFIYNDILPYLCVRGLGSSDLMCRI